MTDERNAGPLAGEGAGGGAAGVATGRPWREYGPYPYGHDIEFGLVVVATVHATNGGYSPTPSEARANAALIVRAVNSHDKLLEALTAAVKWMERACDYCGSEFGSPEDNEEIVAARAALSRAGGV